MSSKSNATQLKLDPEKFTSTAHRLIIGSCEDMSEIEDDSIQLMVTSPPYYNAPLRLRRPIFKLRKLFGLSLRHSHVRPIVYWKTDE